MKTKKEIEAKGKQMAEEHMKIFYEKPKNKIAKENRSKLLNYYTGYLEALEWVLGDDKK